MAARVQPNSLRQRSVAIAVVAGAAVGIPTAGAAHSTPVTQLVPTPIGAGRQFHPGASNAAVVATRPVRSLTCSRAEVARKGVHLELFARGRVVIVPAGIGVSPPLARRGADVVSGRCSYPLRTLEPTGVIEVARSTRLTLGDFFAVWGRPLGAHRLVGFREPRSRVRAYVDGRRYGGALSTIVLRPHAEIVLELGPYIPPHAEYRFRSDL
jgi:hypothetical protein